MDGWARLVHLVPADPGVVPQHPGLGASGAWYLSQGRDNSTGSNVTDDLILTKFTRDGERVGTAVIPRGGHGDRMVMRGDEIGVYVQGVWCWLPWQPGTMTVSDAQAHRGLRERCPLAARQYCQGEVDLGHGTWLRLYGGSIKGGPQQSSPHPPATLEVLQDAKVVRELSLDRVARDQDGLPVGGRYEPEGIALATVDGDQWVIVGFSVGRLGSTTMLVFGRPLHEVLEEAALP